MLNYVNKKQKNNRTKNITIFFVLVFLILISIFGFFNFFSKSVNNTGVPIVKSQNFFSRKIKSIGYFFDTKKYLYDQNEILKQDNQNYKNLMIDYEILKNENISLKESLGRIENKDDFFLAAVLSSYNRSPYDTLIIDAGENIGLKEGMQVFVQANTPIGFLSNIYKKSSQVILYSNPNKETEVLIDGTDTMVKLIGRGGGNFEVTTPIDFEMPDNALFSIPSLYPQVIAKNVSLLSKPNDINKKYLLRSVVNTANIKFVQVKKN